MNKEQESVLNVDLSLILTSLMAGIWTLMYGFIGILIWVIIVTSACLIAEVFPTLCLKSSEKLNGGNKYY